MKLLNDHSLLNLNTFRIKVNAKLFTEIFSAEDLLILLKEDKLKNERKLVLGGGSNILFAKNFDGLVIKNSIAGINVLEENPDSVLIEAGAGVIWDELVRFCVDKNFGGIENLSLIPGSVGAAPVQNIGAYGQELSETFHSLTGIHIETCEAGTFVKNECRFAYRSSVFKEELKDRFIITAVRLRLRKNPAVQTDYGDIQKHLNQLKNNTSSIKDIREIVIKIRSSKLPDPSRVGNAGSFFKNPLVNEAALNTIKSRVGEIPVFRINDELFKIPAGWLIEKCGWKGKRIGNVGTYLKHALIIINHDGAEGKEILEFAMRIKEAVKSKFGIVLEEEVNII